MLPGKNIKLIINYFLGPAVFLLLAWFIYKQVTAQAHWLRSLTEIRKGITGSGRWTIGMVILLMPVNWGVEALKWQLAIRSVEKIHFWNAFKAVLSGTTMASFTPNRMGEYLGRILYVRAEVRTRAISLTLIGSIAQVLITLLAGIAGLFYMRWQVIGAAGPGTGLSREVAAAFSAGSPGQAGKALLLWMNTLVCAALLILLSLTILYFRLSRLMSWLGKWAATRKYKDYIKVLEEFPTRILIRILLLSFLRYAIFMVQYQLLFSVFGVGLSGWQSWGGMSVVFLVMAIVPTFTFLTELGLRWEASIQIIEFFSKNTVGIFATSFGIWLINLIIPALAGSLLILSIKLFRNK